MVSSIEIEYLTPKLEYRVGSVKNIAVPSNNKEDIRKMYPSSKRNESNADMLSQSFGTTPEIVLIPSTTENLQVENTSEPVQITPIPVAQNSNLENEPVNLNMNISTPVMPSMDLGVSNAQPVQEPLNVSVEPIIENNSAEVIPNQVEPQIVSPIMENTFKVSDAPNIFDNPAPTNVVEVNQIQENTNMFNVPLPERFEENDKTKEFKSDLNDDIISAEIAILESDIKHYEGLVENNRKKIELLRKQMKKEETEVNLENTASNLFNNSGILDEDKVLGKTPMPNFKIA